MIRWEHFDRIYLISLADRPERRRHALKQIGRFIGNDLPQLQIFDAIRPTEAAGFPGIGARGCFLSHLEVLKQSVAAGHERVLILEDDICFDSSIRSVDLPEEWDWVYLGHSVAASPPTRVEKWAAPVQMTHCYAVSAAALSRLIPYLEAILRRAPGDPKGGPMPVDGAFSWFRAATPQLSTWIVFPSSCGQASFVSEIAPKRWFDRVPALKQVAGWSRGIKRSRWAGKFG